MLATLFEIFFYTSLGVIAIPSVVLAFNFRRLQPAYKWLAFILWFSILCDIVAEIFYRTGIHVNFASSTYAILNPLFISGFFYYAIGWQKLLRWILAINVAYLLFAIPNFTFFQKIDINSYSYILEKLIIMGFSVIYYYKLLKELPQEKVHKIAMFKIVSIIFIINSAKLVLYSFVTYLTSSFKDNLLVLFTIHNAMSIIQSGVIAFALLSERGWRIQEKENSDRHHDVTTSIE